MENPFADPVARLTPTQSHDNSQVSRVDTGALDKYNPFEASSDAKQDITNPRAPPYSAIQAQKITTAELERRQRELDAKAAELARREEEQRAREVQNRPDSLRGVTTKNWPPLPSFCPCTPCFYQNIETDIVPEYKRVVKFGYYLWLSYACLLIVNLFTAMVYFFGTSNYWGGSLFGVAILVFIICIPSSYLCWFRPLYKAFRSNSSINFFIFFIVFGVQVLVMIIQSIGILNWGSCGWITGLAVVKLSPVIGIMTLLVACMFTVITGISAWYLIHVHHIYRSTGASFGKAKQEFTHGIISDPLIRNGAVEAGLFAARQTTSAGS
ncbi:Secretory carrier-associated membrane protein isoform 3 [Schistosoma japonicum]|uniref:Secretory carrier-associated membrane protein n=1 Tax=Schistosoma japonicum TaxID=6182 RepID=A0A4Z2DIK4_SCHJA|nr:Secretory carrier-associated membrane protein 3 [Schistosoma japonicum]TNN16324.1 Secretory carrier-associated membrane protein isoform 3 [Schistosoma japonicum]